MFQSFAIATISLHSFVLYEKTEMERNERELFDIPTQPPPPHALAKTLPSCLYSTLSVFALCFAVSFHFFHSIPFRYGSVWSADFGR